MIDFDLYLITDRKAVPAGRSLLEAVHGALDGGVQAVQLREKDLGARELLGLAEDLRALTDRYRARLLINDRIDVALAVGADGVHLGGQSLPVAKARALLGARRLIGVSTHAPEEISAAHRDGADFATYGPVFFTPSKASYGSPQGLERLRQACAGSPLPVFALGGVKLHHLPDVMGCGVRGVAVISAVLASAAPAEAVRSLLSGINTQ